MQGQMALRLARRGVVVRTGSSNSDPGPHVDPDPASVPNRFMIPLLATPRFAERFVASGDAFGILVCFAREHATYYGRRFAHAHTPDDQTCPVEARKAGS